MFDYNTMFDNNDFSFRWDHFPHRLWSDTGVFLSVLDLPYMTFWPAMINYQYILNFYYFLWYWCGYLIFKVLTAGRNLPDLLPEWRLAVCIFKKGSFSLRSSPPLLSFRPCDDGTSRTDAGVSVSTLCGIVRMHLSVLQMHAFFGPLARPCHISLRFFSPSRF